MKKLALFLLACSGLYAQTTAVPASIPQLTFVNNQGVPMGGAYLCSFQGGTSTPLATWTSSSGSVANTNPVVLNSNGQASVWLTPGTLYKFILYTGGNGACPGSGVASWTQDNVSSAASYSLPMATSSVLGGIICGTGVSCAAGVLSVTPYTLPQATNSTLGGVICGSGVTCTSGVLNNSYVLPNASATNLGGVVCGFGTKCASGVMTAEDLVFASQGFSATLTFTGSSNVQAFNKTFVIGNGTLNQTGTTMVLDVGGTYTNASCVSGGCNGTVQFSIALDNVTVATSSLISYQNGAIALPNGQWTFHVPMTTTGTGTAVAFLTSGSSMIMRGNFPNADVFTNAGNLFDLTITHTIQVFAYCSITNGQTLQITGFNLYLYYPQFSF